MKSLLRSSILALIVVGAFAGIATSEGPVGVIGTKPTCGPGTPTPGFCVK